MKRITSLLLVLLTLLALTIPCAAADEELTITNAAIKQGETIYLRITLNKDLKGDSIGISFEFDDTLLKPLPKLSTWEKQGALQDFNVNHAGVWAASSSANLKGDLCVLAFKVLDGAVLSETEVTCAVTIKNGTKVLGEYTAEATVSMHCDHEYDSIKDNGQIGHTKTCKLCQKTVTQSHNWSEDKVIPNPNSTNTNLQVYVCTECDAEKQVPVAIEKEDHSHTHPTEPPVQNTEPTAPQPTLPPPETRPQESIHTPTEPTHPNHEQSSDSNRNPTESNDKNNQSQGNSNSSQGNQNSSTSKPNTNDKNYSSSADQTKPTTYVDYNSDPVDADDPHAGHDHANDESSNKPPMIVEGNGTIETVPTEHDHDHEDVDGDQGFPIGAAVAFAVLAILMVGLPIYLFKTRKRI